MTFPVFRCRWIILLMVAALTRGAVWAQSTQAAVERYYEAGQKALAAGDYAQAETAYERLRQITPGVAEIHANLGLIYFQERKYELAVTALRQALKLKPSMERAETLLAMSLSETGQMSEALPSLQKAFRRSSDSAMRRMCGLELQRAYTTLHRDRAAVEIALDLTKLFPKDPEVLYHTGKVFGNYAYLTITKIAEVAPTSVWRHQAAAEAFESTGATDSALSEYQQVLALDPHRAGVHYRMGRTLVTRSWEPQAHSDDVAEASKQFEQELEIDPSNANAAYELAEIRRRSRQFEEARELFERALKSYPDFEEAHLGLASVLLSLRQPEPALPHLQKAIALKPNDEIGWYRLSQVQSALGNSEEQHKALTKYRELHDKELQREGLEPVFSPREITKQELDPKERQ